MSVEFKETMRRFDEEHEKRMKALDELMKELEKEHKESEIINKYKASRLDYYDAVISALFDLNPKLKEHPAIKDFIERHKKAQAEIEEIKVKQ